MSLSNGHKAPPDVSSTRKPRRLLLVILCLFIGFALILAGLWSQRLAIIEMSARNSLEKEKVVADFSITDLTANEAVIDDIRLMRGEDVFFSAQRLTLSYDWRKVRDLEFNTIAVKNPALHVELDKTGNIISDWMQNSRNDGQRSDFSAKNITITEGRLHVQSPYGTIETGINANIVDLASGQVKLQVKPSILSFQGVQTEVAGAIDASLEGNDVDVKLDLSVPALKYGHLSLEAATVKGPFSVDIGNDVKTLESDVDLNFAKAAFQDLAFGAGDVSWAGQISEATADGALPSLSGTWSAQLDDMSMTDPDRRRRLAKSLTLYDSLTAISSLAPFAPALSLNLDGFLGGSHLKAAGRVDISSAGQIVTLTETATLERTGSPNEKVTLDPSKGGAPIYQFSPSTNTISLSFDGRLSGKQPLTLKNAVLKAQPKSGQNLSNLQSFGALLQTHSPWQAQTPSGGAARLAPFSAAVNYRAADNARYITMNAGVEFDGDVPGGYVQGAKATGLLSLNLNGPRNVTNFKPAADERISIDRFETVTDWVFEDLNFALKPSGPQLYKRAKDNRQIAAQISGARGRLINRLSQNDMAFDFESALVSGELLDNQQKWHMSVQDAHMTSDSFPSPGTDIFAPTAVLTALVETGKPVQFSVESPNADIKTQLISAKNMKVSASGTPNDIRADYGQGLVKFSAGELPVLPLTGSANYDGAQWTGRANTVLPRAANTPIDISYGFSNGVGTADVHFEGLEFKPRGLQPKHLASAFAGKLSRVDGLVSSDIHLSFGANQPLQSSGTVTIMDMDAATLPGPLSGINSVLKFSSFFPLQTDGVQRLTLDGFDPGFPLTGGDVTFEVVPDGIKLTQAQWPLGGGFITLKPTTWRYNAAQNRVVLAAENVELGEFFKDMAGGKFSATGLVNGELPVVIEGVRVNVENGRLAVDNGGVIQYKSAETDAAGEANAYAGYAFDALKNFEYQEMEAEINGPLDGEMKLRMKFEGSNPDVLYGSKFLFNVGVEGELLNIARSFQTGAAIQQSIVDQIRNTGPAEKADLDTTDR